MNERKQRFWTGAAIAVVTYMVLILSSKPGVMTWASLFLTLAALYEINQASGMCKDGILVLQTAAASILLLCLPDSNYPRLLFLAYSAAVLAFVHFSVSRHPAQLDRPWKNLLVIVCLVVLIRAIPFLRAQPQGYFYIFTVVTTCFITDASAYHVGKRWGKHKPIPKVSPNKTIEGSFGGTALTIAVLCLLKPLITWITGASYSWNAYLLLVLCISVAAQIGDLIMSALKRCYGIKDFGTILPGHGGILDRFDSHIFVVASLAIWLRLFNQ